MPRKFKPDQIGDDERHLAQEIVEKVRKQVGTFSVVCGELRNGEREDAVVLRRKEWMALLDYIWKLTPKRDDTDSMMVPMRSYWAVRDQIDRALRSGERISGNEAIKRAARKLGKPAGTVKRHYNAMHKLVTEHYPNA